MKDVTLCTVTMNALYAGALMWETYLRFHERPLLYVYDNNSSDGIAEYFKERANYFYQAPQNNEHGIGLDHLCKQVKTEYILTVDTDVEFTSSILPFMLRQNTPIVTHEITSPGQRGWCGELLNRQKTIDVSLALLKTKVIQELLKTYSFTPYFNTALGQAWDTGAMLYNVCKTMAIPITEVDLTPYRIHYGSITCALYAGINQWMVKDKKIAYKQIQQRLAELRNSRLKLPLI